MGAYGIGCFSNLSDPSDTLWTKTYGGTGNDQFNFVLETSDNGFIVVGYTQSFGNGGSDVWLIKTDENGNEEWAQTFGGSGGDEGHSVQTTTDGGYIIIGNTQIGNGEADVWLIKTDVNGNEEWNQSYGGDAAEVGFAVLQIDNGGYVILAYTQTFGNGGGDGCLIKTSLLYTVDAADDLTRVDVCD